MTKSSKNCSFEDHQTIIVYMKKLMYSECIFLMMGVSSFWMPSIQFAHLEMCMLKLDLWQRLGCCCKASPFHLSFTCASAIVEQPRWVIACDMSWIVTCRRSSSKHMHWFIRLMVSLVMMASAFGVPKPPCSGPAQNVTSGKLELTFHALLKARIHKNFKFIDFLWIPVRNGCRVPENRDNGNLHHPGNLVRVVHVLCQLLDGVERFLPDTVTFKSQVTSDCEMAPQVLDWVPRHHYLRLAISDLKNTEIKRALSTVLVACYLYFAHVDLNTCPFELRQQLLTQAERTFISCTFVVMSVESSAKHNLLAWPLLAPPKIWHDRKRCASLRVLLWRLAHAGDPRRWRKVCQDSATSQPQTRLSPLTYIRGGCGECDALMARSQRRRPVTRWRCN